MKHSTDLSEFEKSFLKYQRDLVKRSIDIFGVDQYKNFRRELRELRNYHRDIDGSFLIPEHYGPIPIAWFISMSGFIESRELKNANKKIEANEALMDAVHACGVFQGFTVGRYNFVHEAIKMASNSARKAAFKRHSEHHALKADAMKYYADNIDSFKSMDDAAEKIAGKIVPAKFRTVRKWITEYHKNLRSAGTT